MMSNSKDAAAVETESIQDKAMSHRSENETSCSVNQLIDMKKEDTTDLTDMIKPDNPEAVSTSIKRLNRMRRRGRLHKRQIESAAEGVDLKDGEVNNLKRQKVDNEEDNLQYHHAETDWYIENGLRKVYPYQYTYLCYCKGRWKGKTILDVLNSEFMSSSLEFHTRQIENGGVKVNGKSIRPDYTLKGKNELISNLVHRHELPVTSQSIQIIANTDDYLAVNKPSSVPVHPCGRYRHNSLTFMLSRDHGFHNLRTLYRLDRLTSGLIIFGKNSTSTNVIMDQIKSRQVSKTYLCRVEGSFPEGKVECKEPLDKVHPKIGTWRVRDGGKQSHTIFERVNCNGTSSVVRCYPQTGRTHQIRVHLQFLGHPILNDPLYNDDVWGPSKGKGGHYGKTDEELYHDLLELHSTKIFEDLVPDTGSESSSCVANPKHHDLIFNSKQDSETHLLRLTPDPNCDFCLKKYQDPTPDKLTIYLHALSYKGDGWEFSTEEPDWAKENWSLQ